VESLGEDQRRQLYDRFGRRYAAGARLYGEGAASDVCYVLQDGRVRLLKRIRDHDRSLAVLRPGDLFGEDALAQVPRSATAVALTDVEVLALDRGTFGVLLSSNPEVALRLVAQLVHRLRHAEEQLENAMLRDHPSRVVNTLLRLAAAEKVGETEDGQPILEVSPLELASRVGLDVDTVKRSIQQLRDGGYVRIHDERIVLPDRAALEQLFELLGKKEEVRGGFV
jgi:CRP/FNR family cyclic AMP-dependent transcriptional regulator